MLYIILFIIYIFLILAFIQYILSSFSTNSDICTWDINYALMQFDLNREKQCKDVLNLLAILNITYFFSEGSALGAYRNHGAIINDHDYDVVVPIWMNSHIFKCKDYININRVHGEREYFLSNKYRVCDKDRKDYFDILINYVHSFSIFRGIKTILKKWNIFNYTSLHIPFEKTIIDIFLILGNEYAYENINICKCKFCNSYGYCLLETPIIVRKQYGNDFFVYKDRNKGGNNKMKRFIIY